MSLLRHPVWLAGTGCMVARRVARAVALDEGSPIAVQSLTALSPVIALYLGVEITQGRDGPALGPGLVDGGVVCPGRRVGPGRRGLAAARRDQGSAVRLGRRRPFRPCNQCAGAQPDDQPF